MKLNNSSNFAVTRHISHPNINIISSAFLCTEAGPVYVETAEVILNRDFIAGVT